MAAPGDRGTRVCPHCFIDVEPAAGGCSDPDCPFRPGSLTPAAADEAIYPDLARANLLRMRGDYKAALELLHSVLKRHPGSVAGHSLLGDIHAEQGDLESAIRWFELALELNPDGTFERDKLANLRVRKGEQEASRAAKELGMPTSSGQAKVFAGMLALIVVLVGVGFFLLGSQLRAARDKAPDVGSIDVGRVPTPGAPDGDTAGRPPVQPDSARTEPRAAVAVDAALLQRVIANCTEGSRVVAAFEDPREGAIVITYQVAATDDAKAIGARLAASALGVFPQALTITVRAFAADRMLYMGDLKREAMAADPATGDRPDPLVSMSNEWKPG